jgi:hypothetical protein
MPLVLHAESHVDHGLTEDQRIYIMDHFRGKDGFFAETITLPEFLDTVPCSLYGPSMGDTDISEASVYYAKRGTRSYPSRLVSLPVRYTRLVTVIAGPHDNLPCVLYTAFGGPVAPKEPADPNLKEHEKAASIEFWSKHALSAD